MSFDEQDRMPEEVQRFILLAVPSVPYLEALLLLRHDPTLAWDAVQVARRLYLHEKAAQGLLDQLYASAVLSAAGAGTYRYAPQTAQLRALIDRVADAYSHNLVGVSKLIHSKTENKAQQFGAAFVPRK
ncbi:MAG: hypothetical protein ACXW2U_00495 [Telluria sp.]